MPKQISRKNCKTWSEEAMSLAVREVKAGFLSVRKASEKYSVPKSSLGDRVTGKVAECSVWGSSPKLNKIEEQKLVQMAKDRSAMGIGFSKHNFLRAAAALGKMRDVNFKTGKPSDMWWRRLKTRHRDFSLRSPEGTASNRHSAMTKDRMDAYFGTLQRVLISNNLSSTEIWNMDETGICLSHKPGKVVAAKGAKSVHAKNSTSRELITVIACANANGDTVPPHFILPGKTSRCLQSYDTSALKKTPIRTANISVSDSGWTKDGLCKLWFTSTFLPAIGDVRPQLLICDGHSSHNNVEFIELARAADIIIMELPSHTSNWTQPLDRSCFKALKNSWNREVDNFTQLTGLPVGHAQFFRLFAKSWEAATEKSIIKNGFKATGICPFDPNAIPDEAYAPSKIYAREETHQNGEVQVP